MVVLIFSLQLMLQNDTISPSKLSYVFRRLISLTETKLNAYEWFEQLVQVTESLGVNLPATETEWFVGKSWNIVGFLLYVCQLLPS